MKAFQVHEDESGWGGFLIDEDTKALLPFLDRFAVLAKAHDDTDIVQEAWSGNRTIVTSNGRDFVRHIREFQRRQNNRECRDLWGLVVMPNAQLSRNKGLERLRLGLNIPKVGMLRWPGAGFLNLYVHAKPAGGIPTIRRFERCTFCEGREVREPWDAWYHSLAVIGAE